MTTNCGIYKLTNITNGKIYIGQSRDIKRRWWSHGAGIKENCPKLHRAIKKYGKKLFTLTILEQVQAPMEDLGVILTQREQFYLDTFQPFGENGYNISPTATTGLSRKGVVKRGKTQKGMNNCHNKSVCQYDSQGTKLNMFYSIQHASEVLNINRMSITNCFIGRAKTAGGFIWALEGETPNFIKQKTRLGCHHTEQTKAKISQANSGVNHHNFGKPAHNRKAVIALDSHHNIICCFLSLEEAAVWAKLKHRSCISRACSNPNKQAGGYYWTLI